MSDSTGNTGNGWRRRGDARMRIRLKHQRLAELIAGSPVSQNRWAQRLGLGRGHLSLLINGKRPYPEPETRQKLLDGLELEFDELFEAENPWVPERRRGWRQTFHGLPAAPRERSSMNRVALVLSELRQDLSHALRSLTSNPDFAVVAVLTLALGIGANTAIFSVVQAVLLRPLPFEDPGRLMTVWEDNTIQGWPEDVTSFGTFNDWRRSEAFEEMAAYSFAHLTLTGTGEPRRVWSARVTPSFFPTLGIDAAAGRRFLPEEGEPGSDDVVLLSHAVWTRQFGADPDIIGETISLDGEPRTVVGVMPEGFDFPREAELWTPLAPEDPDDRYNHWLRVVGRLSPGTTPAAARAELETTVRNLEREYPEVYSGIEVTIVPLREELLGDVRPVILLLFGAVGFVLLIACANVANLLLARSSFRRREIAVRAVLGADRGRLIRQLLTESFVLSACGGIAGAALAAFAVTAIAGGAPADIPRIDEVAVDPIVLGFAVALTLVTALLFGLAPALQVSGTDLREALVEYGRTSFGGVRARRGRDLMVVAEVALTVVLLVATGLMIRTVGELRSIELGFEPRGVLSFDLELPRSTYPESRDTLSFYDSLMTRIRGLPGMESVAAVAYPPLGRGVWSGWITIENRPPVPREERREVKFNVVRGDYFELMGIPLIAGGRLHPGDAAEDAPGVVVNRAFVEHYWPDGGEPVGSRLTTGTDPPEDADWVTIRGVVGNVVNRGLTEPTMPEIYLPHGLSPDRELTVLVRTATEPMSLAGPIRDVVHSMDPTLPLSRLTTQSKRFHETTGRDRYQAFLMSLFSGLALCLAAVGIYGVVAHGVGQRTREIGLRMALGARGPEVLRVVAARGMALVGAGLVLGLVAAVAASRLLESMVYGVGLTDPLTYAAVTGFLAAVSLAACLTPAARAIRIDPVVALRED